MSGAPSPRRRRDRSSPLSPHALKGPSRAPRPRDGAPAHVLPRALRSHTNDDGTPKTVMTSIHATEMAARHGMVAYLCSQAPEHYHIGRRADHR